jgi:hypothetical protein
MALTITSKEPSNTRLVHSDQAGHWYTAEGESAHTVLGKNGNFRNTTVADARKMLLYPSVTSILSILDKPQLTNWKIEQAIMACLTLPKEENETLEDYAKRVVKDSKESTGKAAEHGTKMHTEMENILLGRAVSGDETLAPYIETFKKWSDANIEKTYWCEKGLVGAGYAGRCDAYVKLRNVGDAIIDLKNRKVNPKYDPFYDTDCAQLWAYRSASENPKCACVSVVLASNDPTKLMTKVWDEDELYQAGIAFCAMQKVWSWVKQYTPPGMKL